jgi:CheY-like chemotaxis protein
MSPRGRDEFVSSEPLQGLTVLVIDDHYDTVEMLVEYLRSFDAIVIGLRSAKAAMGYAMTARFDAVLIDLRMPGEDGRWFLRELRNSNAIPGSAGVRNQRGTARYAPRTWRFCGLLLQAYRCA